MSMAKENAASVEVTIQDLTKVFLGQDKKESVTTAVDNISLSIPRGKMVTLLGPSGCGKTTVLRMISGFAMPTKGRILFNGKDVTDIPPNRRDIGMMFQSYALFPHLSVYENIAYGLRVKKTPAPELRQRMDAVLKMMDIEKLQNRIPEQLSGGQQQRVALARAIVTEPAIMLFDEPLSNLDAKMREYMREELRKLQKKLDITSIYVTHDQSEAMAISDLIVIMRSGIVEQLGSPYEIYTRPSSRFVADFIGRANFVDVTVKSLCGDKALVELLGQKVEVAVGNVKGAEPGQALSCMIRPEFVKLQREGGYTAVVRRSTYFGHYMEYELEIGNELLNVTDYDLHANGIHAEGESVCAQFLVDNLCLLDH